jgi:hypothetical protein
MKMKNKLMLSILSTIILSLALITALYMTIINYQHEENTKRSLKENNELVISVLETEVVSDVDLYFKSFSKSNFRLSLINKEGKVIHESGGKIQNMDNHNSRKEVITARKYGEGYSIRYSDTLKKVMVYYATQFEDGYIIRSSMPMEVTTGFEGNI